MNSYEEILESMKEKYKELTGNSVADYSDIDVRFKVLAGEIYKEQVNLEFIKNQMFVQTATGEYLDYHGLEKGIVRKGAVKSKGKVDFILSDPLENDLTIPKGTVVSTSSDNPVRFYTDNSVVIEAGERSVTAECTAEKEGRSSNVAPEEVNLLITAVPGISGVVNNAKFTGGADKESDEALRQRITRSYNDISTGTNSAYYKKLALSVDGVMGAKILSQALGPGSVGVYICGDREPATASQISQVQKVLDEARELNVKIRVVTASKHLASFHIYISVLDGFDFDDVAQRVKDAIIDYAENLEIGESIIKNQIGRVVISVNGVKDYEFGSFYENEYEAGVDVFFAVDDILLEELVE